MTITENIRYIGVNDHETDLFEGQFAVPDGMRLRFGDAQLSRGYALFERK